MRTSPGVIAILVGTSIVITFGGLGVEALESDLATSVGGPIAAAPGDTATIAIGYENLGPDSALGAYVNAYIPSGVPVPLDEMTPAQFDALQASVVPDGLGNTAYLFVDETFCENLMFQVQEDTGITPTAAPIVGLDNGVSAAVTYDLVLPMEPPEIAALIIDEPAALAGEFKAAEGFQWLTASDWGRYTRATCDIATTPCDDLSLCFGPRVAYIDPIVADFELVNDGSADPTFGCGDLIGFNSGNVAVIKRGGCEFGEKGVKAQDAGAVAVLLVNDDRCIDEPNSTRCSINMAAGVAGNQVTIPLVMLSMDDGQPVIDALAAATVVSGRLGPVSESLTLTAWSFLDVGETDPNPANDHSAFDLEFGWIFIDGFESGDTTLWSSTVP